jgi:hypothetical protein
MSSLIPLFKGSRRPRGVAPADYVAPGPPDCKAVARSAFEELKEIRGSLRVRVNRPEGYERKTSVFNLFVRETMKSLKDGGVTFASTTERMKECGRLWRLHKEAAAAEVKA